MPNASRRPRPQSRSRAGLPGRPRVFQLGPQQQGESKIPAAIAAGRSLRRSRLGHHDVQGAGLWSCRSIRRSAALSDSRTSATPCAGSVYGLAKWQSAQLLRANYVSAADAPAVPSHPRTRAAVGGLAERHLEVFGIVAILAPSSSAFDERRSHASYQCVDRHRRAHASPFAAQPTSFPAGEPWVATESEPCREEVRRTPHHSAARREIFPVSHLVLHQPWANRVFLGVDGRRRGGRGHGAVADRYTAPLAPVSQYTTLVIDVVDAKTSKVVWRGWAQDSMTDIIDSQDRLRKQVDEAVTRMMPRLPPGGAGEP